MVLSVEQLPPLITPRAAVSVLPCRSRVRAAQSARDGGPAATDHVKIPNTEPCCRNTPLLVVPQKPFRRRSSRLRGKMGGRGPAAEAEPPADDVEAAEWVSRVLTDNGVVEVDPMTIAEHMGATETAVARPPTSLTTTSTSVAPGDSAPLVGGFPKLPHGVAAAAAGSAVVLATVAVLVQALRTPRAAPAKILNPSKSVDGDGFRSGFGGEPVSTSDGMRHAPQLPRREITNKSKKSASDTVVASTTGAVLTMFELQPGSVRTRPDGMAMPLPPSISRAWPQSAAAPSSTGGKDGPSSSSGSVTPIGFPPDRPLVPQSRPREPNMSRPSQPNLESVTPCFPSDLSPAPQPNLESVTSFIPSDRSPAPQPNYESVTPFFPSDRTPAPQPDFESVTSFFPPDQSLAPQPNPKSVPPFSPPDQSPVPQLNYESVAPQLNFKSVTPFFPSDQSPPPQPDFESVTSLFPPDQSPTPQLNYEPVTPFFSSDQSPPVTELQKAGSERVAPLSLSHATAEPRPKGMTSSDASDGVGGWDRMRPQGHAPPSRRCEHEGPAPAPARPAQFQAKTEAGASDDKTMRDFVASTKRTEPPQIAEQRSVGDDGDDPRGSPHWTCPVCGGATAGRSGEQALWLTGRTNGPDVGGKVRLQHGLSPFGGGEAPLMETEPIFEGQIGQADPVVELSPEELALLAEAKAEEERQNAKYRAFQAAFPAVAIGAGVIGAFAGVDGAFEMVGLTATASFISYELLWANTRKELLDELTKITDHKKLFKFLRKRKIVKEC